MEGHASAWHHREEAAHSGFLAMLVIRCTQALGCAATVSQLHFNLSAGPPASGWHNDTLAEHFSAFWNLYHITALGGESEAACVKRKHDFVFLLSIVLVLLLFLGLGVPAAICLEISLERQLLSEDSLRLDLLYLLWTRQCKTCREYDKLSLCYSLMKSLCELSQWKVW